MGLSRLFGVCFTLLFASSVSAAVTIDLGPSDYRNWGTNSSHTGAGIRSSFGQTVRMPPLNTSLSVNRNAVIPYGSIANGMRQFLRVNPASIAASAAVTGLFLAVDWVFDQEKGEWVYEEIDITDEVMGDFYWYTTSQSPQFSTPLGACQWYVDQGAPICTGCVAGSASIVEFTSPNQAICEYQWRLDPPAYTRRTVTKSGGDSCPSGYIYYPDIGGCGVMIAKPISEQQWAELEASLPQSSPAEVGEAASDSMKRQGGPLPGYSDETITGPSSVAGPETTTTSTDPVTGDTTITTTQTTTNITYGDTTITTTNTTTTNTYTNGQHTGSETVTETPGELPVDSGSGAPPAGEWPGFCDWASIVCDWIGWTQEEPPAEPDLPQVIDDDFYEEKTIQFGAKTCPPDYEINIPFLNTVVAVSMQPLCDFAGIIYYMVMAAAYIIAAYITVGVARNG